VERTDVPNACLQLLLWVENGGTMSHCPPQSIAKIDHSLLGSTVHTPTVVPRIVAESSTVVLSINDDVHVP
jgi:hypothetical protein